MSDAPRLRPFVIEALTDLGAAVSEDDSLVWVQAPESVQRDLEVTGRFALAFDPERNREFEAELVAPGSYFLERLVSVVVRRGRWDVSQYTVTGADWISEGLHECGLGPENAVSSHVDGIEDGLLLLFAFRVTLVSDEKRESFHLVAVSPVDGSTWPVDPNRADRGLVPHPSPGIRPDLEAGYRLAIEFPDGTGIESRFDAWSGRLRGLACRICGGTAGPWRPSARDGLRCATCASTPAESARPRGRPKSDTPRRGTRAGEASTRFPRGSRARSRGASSGRPRP